MQLFVVLIMALEHRQNKITSDHLLAFWFAYFISDGIQLYHSVLSSKDEIENSMDFIVLFNFLLG